MSAFSGQFDDASEDENDDQQQRQRLGLDFGASPKQLHRFGGVHHPTTPQQAHMRGSGHVSAPMRFVHGSPAPSPDNRQPRSDAARAAEAAAFKSLMQSSQGKAQRHLQSNFYQQGNQHQSQRFTPQHLHHQQQYRPSNSGGRQGGGNGGYASEMASLGYAASQQLKYPSYQRSSSGGSPQEISVQQSPAQRYYARQSHPPSHNRSTNDGRFLSTHHPSNPYSPPQVTSPVSPAPSPSGSAPGTSSGGTSRRFTFSSVSDAPTRAAKTAAISVEAVNAATILTGASGRPPMEHPEDLALKNFLANKIYFGTPTTKPKVFADESMTDNEMYHDGTPQKLREIMMEAEIDSVNQKLPGVSAKAPPETDRTMASSTGASSGRGRGRVRVGRNGRGGGRGSRGGGRGGRGRGKKVLSVPTSPGLSPHEVDQRQNSVGDTTSSTSHIKEGAPHLPPPRWYAGHVPLGLEEDKYWLSELQVYLRSHFAEAFGATEKDIAAPMHGRNKPIALGQVGIRCMHCRDDPPSERGQQAVSYPSLITGIYNSVQQMYRLHFDCCLAMPSEVRRKIETLRESSSSRGGRKQYWVDSAKRLGLVDTPHGIHFGRDPYGPLPPLGGPSGLADGNFLDGVENLDDFVGSGNGQGALPGEKTLGEDFIEAVKKQKEDTYPLVLPDDKPLISDYLYLTLEQMEPCKLMDADRVGCYKGREVGFRGLACKHCVGQAGCGRYFPASEASLSQTTTSQTILNHVRNCRRCPIEIRENLELMKRAKMGPDGKKFDKPKHGGRKVFFHRLWCRIQGLKIDEDDGVEVKIGRQKGAKNKNPKAKKKKLEVLPSDSEDEDEKSRNKTKNRKSSKRDEETDSDDQKSVAGDDSSQGTDDDTRSSGRNGHLDDDSVIEGGSSTDDDKDLWFEGRKRLSKPDDPHWLSELHCYMRSEMVEAFSVAEDDVDGNTETGQVGIRCVFCAHLRPEERPKGHVYFPSSLVGVYQAATDLQRRHFISCPEMPEEIRETLKSLRGFGAKAEGDTQQYWIDSARELGLSSSNSSDGIRFFRDPNKLSPADELDKTKANSKANSNASQMKSFFVRPEDKAIVTDYVSLLLRQVKPCRFKKSDRRGGPGSRGRDRAIGFPGLACVHCATKNNFGRYFPVAAKNLADNTANSISTHLESCSRCPQAVKASLAYLLHRSMLQKVELSAGWKRTFYKRVWDRLHNDRRWNEMNETEGAKDGNGGSVSEESDEAEEKNKTEQNDAEKHNEDDSEGLLNGMEDLIKAAAQWLCERDADEAMAAVKTRGGRGRALQAKRLGGAPKGRGRGTPAKRRRVHF